MTALSVAHIWFFSPWDTFLFYTNFSMHPLSYSLHLPLLLSFRLHTLCDFFHISFLKAPRPVVSTGMSTCSHCCWIRSALQCELARAHYFIGKLDQKMSLMTTVRSLFVNWGWKGFKKWWCYYVWGMSCLRTKRVSWAYHKILWMSEVFLKIVYNACYV